MGSIACPHPLNPNLHEDVRSKLQPQFLVIGAGSRGSAYARAVTASTAGVIAAVAEPDVFKRREFGRKYIWGSALVDDDNGSTHTKTVEVSTESKGDDDDELREGQEFTGWEGFIEWEVKRRSTFNTVTSPALHERAVARGTATSDEVAEPKASTKPRSNIVGAFICTLDETHSTIIRALAPLGLHILCEKPLALSLSDCLSISRSLGAYDPRIVSIGHVLRYSPHNVLLRRLLVEEKAIGEIVSIEHTEPVGWWHFAHSYVRGNWRRGTYEIEEGIFEDEDRDKDGVEARVEARGEGEGEGEAIRATSNPNPGKQPDTPSTLQNSKTTKANGQDSRRAKPKPKHKVKGKGVQVGSLLTKSCHDIDFLMWLLCSPSPLTGSEPHLPTTITSSGALTQFRRSRKPRRAGRATNCTNCAASVSGRTAEPAPNSTRGSKEGGAVSESKHKGTGECIYDAVRIYRDRWLRRERDTGWPLKIVVPEIEDIVSRHRSDETTKAAVGADGGGGGGGGGWEAAETRLMEKLAEDYEVEKMSDEEIAHRSWFGRCVYEADNDVVDDQVVVMTWDEHHHHDESRVSGDSNNSNSNDDDDDDDDDDDGRDRTGRGPKSALFHMTSPTAAQCERRGRIYGSRGEISYDSRTVSVHTFGDGEGGTQTFTVPKQPAEVAKAHGGGDWGLAGAFVAAVLAVEGGVMDVHDAQTRYVGCDLDEIVRSHAVVFAAEEARARGEVVRFREWWDAKREKWGLDGELKFKGRGKGDVEKERRDTQGMVGDMVN